MVPGSRWGRPGAHGLQARVSLCLGSALPEPVISVQEQERGHTCHWHIEVPSQSAPQNVQLWHQSSAPTPGGLGYPTELELGLNLNLGHLGYPKELELGLKKFL